jgi:riboflavin kinase / FMN adenylyltransferase
MEVVRGHGAVAPHPPSSSVTVGFFDGVHRGHQGVISRTVELARARSLRPVAVTFDRHPRETYASGTAPPLLTTLERKADLIARLGVETLLVLEFTAEVARWPPEAFVRRVLADGLGAAVVVVGRNFTFGDRGLGTVETLEELGRIAGFDVEGVPLLRLDGAPLSSSSIREALANGNLTWPTTALGRRFMLDGEVTTGAGRGARLGWPTANLRVDPGLLVPGRGVYAGRAVLADGAVHTAAINVGTNPTFGEEPLHVEAFLLDFDGELRGQPIALEFWERLREERRFDSGEALAHQIGEDVERTRAVVREA